MIEIINDFRCNLSQDEINSLLEIGWFPTRNIDVEEKVSSLVKDGCIISDFAVKFARRFDGLSKEWCLSRHGTTLAEFDLGGSIAFEKSDYQRFTDNGLLEITPIGEYIVPSGLLTDKFGNFYSFDDWDHIVRLGSFCEFLKGLYYGKFNYTEIYFK